MWTLGHVIVHGDRAVRGVGVFGPRELARGVVPESRSRYEVPWETVTTIAQCRARLEESRRMRLATLDVWPDVSQFDLTYKPWSPRWTSTAWVASPFGLKHDWDHLQIEEIVRQAQALPMS
ncbi:MAG: DinB family protein [Caldilineaceae bacterium]